ncbi:hypothetical protein [Streptomyces sp. NPDC017890]|uniref:hypothetical protein n=1 Tax=Streptomyces sp. NPDC017890 TaxID=3365015 RepID=UPI0037875ABE
MANGSGAAGELRVDAAGSLVVEAGDAAGAPARAKCPGSVVEAGRQGGTPGGEAESGREPGE